MTRHDTDVAVVGGGILGLTCAWEIAGRHPNARITVIEREQKVATHQSGRNSGVVHAGVYYAPGSLKSRLCVEGNRRLEAFCAETGIPLRRPGKLIVAAEPRDLPRLSELERRARAAGVPGLRRLRADEIAEIEPCAVGLAALHSPTTGIIDYPTVCEKLAELLTASGHTISTGTEVTSVNADRSGVTLSLTDGEIRARRALGCAGAWSDRLAELAGADADPRIIPFRGAYLHVLPHRQEIVRGMIYPVPDPTVPFLGIHLTRHLDGSLSIGPTALLVAAVDAQYAFSFRAADFRHIASWPGVYRVAWQQRNSAAVELHHALSRRALVASAARFVPSLTNEDVVAGGSGVRAQAVARDGTLLEDFAFSETPRMLHVRNAPSPGATSSLALAAYVVDRFDESRGFEDCRSASLF